MRLTQIKESLNKLVIYQGQKYLLSACILRLGRDGYTYSAELVDANADRSLVIAKIEDVFQIEEAYT